jgi:hypothetical protein
MPIQVFDRSNPSRNRSQTKWYVQLREDHLRLEPGHSGMPLTGGDALQTAARRLAAGVHEVKLPERGVAQLCRNCKRATRESIWVTRCGPCGELFSPVLWLATGCESCGSAEGAMARLEEHLGRFHALAPTAET